MVKFNFGSGGGGVVYVCEDYLGSGIGYIRQKSIMSFIVGGRY